jgi:hypothetical protein
MINSLRKLKRWVAALPDPKLDLICTLFLAFILFVIVQNQKNIAVLNAILSAISSGGTVFIIRFYLKLTDTIPTVDKLDAVLSRFNTLETRLMPHSYITDEMKNFHNQWIDWRKGLSNYRDLSELESKAWTFLAEAYLAEETKKISEKYILTNTKRYTKLVADVGKHLAISHGSGKSHGQRTLRYHLTGMLPEEFYNGSQIEFLADNSQPIFFCHKWENYQDFYASDYQGNDKNTKIRRCIIVREPNLNKDAISALSTLADLREQSTLSIDNYEKSVYYDLHQDIDSVQKRLFRKCSTEQQQTYAELINSILGRKDYHYWPIAPTKDCKNSGQEKPGIRRNWASLLENFSKSFHGDDPSNASFCVLNNSALNEIDKSKILKLCFKPGWIPEIVLFGRLGIGEEPEEWYFGIVGHWRPFSPDIELRFFTGQQTYDLYRAFSSNIYKKTEVNGNLLELKNS